MSTTLLDPATCWTAAELRRLPAEQRDAILVEAARRADPDYTHNAELMDFEAFREEDLHGRSSSTQPR